MNELEVAVLIVLVLILIFTMTKPSGGCGKCSKCSRSKCGCRKMEWMTPKPSEHTYEKTGNYKLNRSNNASGYCTDDELLKAELSGGHKEFMLKCGVDQATKDSHAERAADPAAGGVAAGRMTELDHEDRNFWGLRWGLHNRRELSQSANDSGARTIHSERDDDNTTGPAWRLVRE